MSSSAKSQLIERVGKLNNVTFQGDTASVNGNEFIQFYEDKLVLTMNDKCRAKFADALKAEPRAQPIPGKDHLIQLSFASELDIEFVFIYLRYAWQCWQ